MTAFAAKTVESGQGVFRWELRSVNHRYFDGVLRLPDTLRQFEPQCREQLRAHCQRGRVEATLVFEPSAATLTYQLNWREFIRKSLNHSIGQTCQALSGGGKSTMTEFQINREAVRGGFLKPRERAF